LSDVRTRSEIAAHTPMLQVACSRRQRCGRYRLDTLVGRHGADAAARIILAELTAESPQRYAARLMEKCNILFPELLTLFLRRSILCVSDRGAWAS